MITARGSYILSGKQLSHPLLLKLASGCHSTNSSLCWLERSLAESLVDKGLLDRDLSVSHFMHHIMGDGQSQGGPGFNNIFCTQDEIDMLRRCAVWTGGPGSTTHVCLLEYSGSSSQRFLQSTKLRCFRRRLKE